MTAQHSSATPEHYTPMEYLDAARAVMGGIDLDPATTAEVNADRVHAGRFFTMADDGLNHTWSGRVWLNPPGGRVRTGSSAAKWWAKLVADYLSGSVEQALFLGFSIEILATSQDAKDWIGSFPFCVPRARIEFVRAVEPLPQRSLFDLDVDTTFLPGESPTHANIIAFLPPATERKHTIACFAHHFGRFGKVRI